MNMPRPLGRLLSVATVAAVLATGLLGAAPAHADHGHSIDLLYIQQMVDGLSCLHAPRDTMNKNGGVVRAYTCDLAGDDDQDDQRWYLTYDAAKKGYRIILHSTGKCLDADKSGGSGARVQLWRCNGTDQQLWELVVNDAHNSRHCCKVPAKFNHPYYLQNVYHTEKYGEGLVLDTLPQSSGGGALLTPFWAVRGEQAWESYELHCMAAYQQHYDSKNRRCE